MKNKVVIFGAISIGCRFSVRHFEEYQIRYFMESGNIRKNKFCKNVCSSIEVVLANQPISKMFDGNRFAK